MLNRIEIDLPLANPDLLYKSGSVRGANAVKERIPKTGKGFDQQRQGSKNITLIDGMGELGFRALSEDPESSGITLFHNPVHPDFSFKNFSCELRMHGVTIYPGEAGNADCFCFRDANPEAIDWLLNAVEEAVYWQHAPFDVLEADNENTLNALAVISEIGWIP